MKNEVSENDNLQSKRLSVQIHPGTNKLTQTLINSPNDGKEMSQHQGKSPIYQMNLPNNDKKC